MIINGVGVNLKKCSTVKINDIDFWKRTHGKNTRYFNKTHKVCPKCFSSKKLEEFEYGKTYFLKLRPECKVCREKDKKEYRIKNRNKVRERKRRYYRNNKEKIQEKFREYVKENKEKVAGYQKNYNKINKERNKLKRKKYLKEYQENNKENIKERSKEYKNSPALYDTYAHQLTVDEAPVKDRELLSVKCTYCGKYYIPTNMSVQRRIRAINNLSQGEHRLYCSEGCKDECPTFRSRGNPTNTKLAREANPALRQAVLKRDGYMCQKCHSTEKLHCHHIVPYKTDPGKSEDTDNCITFCRKCHYEIHGLIDGCGLGDLRMAENKCDNNS